MNLVRECETLLQRYGVPAVGLARIGPEGVEEVACLGERKEGSGIAVTEGDLWHIGSCTKSMTAVLMARLVEQGLLEWDAPLAPLLVGGGAEVHPDFSVLTLRHLLSHRSGMPTDPSAADVDASFHSGAALHALRAALAAEALAQGPASRPGESFHYSNLGYVVAGAVAEGVTGVEWEDLMRSEVFAPLGLSSAGFGAPGREADAGVLGRLLGRRPVVQPWGHMPDGLSDALSALPPHDDMVADSAPVMGPAGTVHLSLPDFARYVAFHASRGATAPGYLQAETIDALHRPLPGEEYALGWFAMSAQDSGTGCSVIWHEGSNNAWYAAMMIVPELGRAWALVCNAYRDVLQDQEAGVLIGHGQLDDSWLTAVV
jgi:CubicO group peptidase (beta-lactamase class C family)